MKGRCNVLLNLVLLVWVARAQAQEISLPVPRAVIYPGETLTESMIDDRITSPEEAGPTYIHSRADLVGKVARRTLLPGKPIPAGAIDQRRLVTIGAQVKIIYAEGGMIIVAFGVAQQAGGAGELIRVRNLESGLFITGRVQEDGSIRVGET